MGRDHTRHEGHDRPLSRTMAQTAPVPAPAASQSPHTGSLRHLGRSSFPHSPLPAQPSPRTGKSRAGHRHPESPPGTSPCRTPPQHPREPLQPRPRNPGPGPRRLPSSQGQGSPSAAHLFKDPALLASPSSGCQGQAVSRSSPHDTPTCLRRRRVAALLSLPTARRAGGMEKRRPHLPRRCAKPGRGCAGCGTDGSRRGCREGGRRDTARMGSTPPRWPTVVPTQSGRGREECQPEGRSYAIPPRQPSATLRRPPCGDHPYASGPAA